MFSYFLDCQFFEVRRFETLSLFFKKKETLMQYLKTEKKRYTSKHNLTLPPRPSFEEKKLLNPIDDTCDFGS